MFIQGGKYIQDQPPRTVQAWGCVWRGVSLTYSGDDEGSGSGWRVAGAQSILNNLKPSHAGAGLVALGQGLHLH